MSSCAYPKKYFVEIKQMDKKEKLLNAIFKITDNAQSSEAKKRLTCAQAFELAQKYDVEIIEIGHICNKHKIKICKCQLGCF
jgi:recombination DNA repair RAD52 pathway protein